jgi:hypothetical protein
MQRNTGDFVHDVHWPFHTSDRIHFLHLGTPTSPLEMHCPWYRLMRDTFGYCPSVPVRILVSKSTLQIISLKWISTIEIRSPKRHCVPIIEPPQVGMITQSCFRIDVPKQMRFSPKARLQAECATASGRAVIKLHASISQFSDHGSSALKKVAQLQYLYYVRIQDRLHAA